MKIFICIGSCRAYALKGSHQAIRETYLEDISSFQNIDYVFSMGDGTPTGEDESEMLASLDVAGCHPYWKDQKEADVHYIPKSDEVFTPIPDRYIYGAWGTRENLRRALKKDYDFYFICPTDTYIQIGRFLKSGFEEYDYVGRPWRNPWNKFTYAGGGSGYCLSKKSAQVLADSKIDTYSEDQWSGTHLGEHGILLHEDRRYSASPHMDRCCASSDRDPLFPMHSNAQITAHLAETPDIYNERLMYYAHDIWKSGI